MHVDPFVIFGLVGVALTVSVGRWAAGVRDWLSSFVVPMNPLRMIGNTMSCTISSGFCAGAVYGLVNDASMFWLYGGIVAVATYATDEVMALLDVGVRKMSGRGSPWTMPIPDMPAKSAPAMPTLEALSARSLTEDEAHGSVTGKSELDQE